MKTKTVKPDTVKNFEFISPLKIFFLSMILISCFAMCFCYFYTKKESLKQYLINFTNSSQMADYKFTFSSSKNWPETGDFQFGTQYDCVIENFSKNTLINWICVLQIPENSKIDSSWSGNFKKNGNSLIITPLDYNNDINNGEPVTFGFVLHANEILDQVPYSISFYKLYDLTSFLPFRILVLVLFGFIIAFIANSLSYFQLKRVYGIVDQTFDTIVNMVDNFDEYTYNHSRNVAFYSMEIAKRMKLKPKHIVSIYYVGLVHDIGKIKIMRTMLNKKGRFTEEEREAMKLHTTAGAEALKDFTLIPEIQEGALYHHERFDGTGYPKGLKGHQIPLFARIICIADCFDAMSTQRSYWEPYSTEKVVEELKSCAGTQFDPEIVPFMLELVKDGIAPVKINEQ